MKEDILKLRKQGKSYREIQKILGCSRGTICFHCGKNQKDKSYQRRRQLESQFRLKLKMESGGKCSNCGYNKCFAALDFHHPNDDKQECVSQLLRRKGFKAAMKESKKCQLLCANCHREQHYDRDGNEIL